LPHLLGRPTQRPGVFFTESSAAVSIVVEECELRPPSHPHGKPRCEQNSNHGLQAVRPCRCRPQWSLGPIELLDQPGHPRRGSQLKAGHVGAVSRPDLVLHRTYLQKRNGPGGTAKSASRKHRRPASGAGMNAIIAYSEGGECDGNLDVWGWCRSCLQTLSKRLFCVDKALISPASGPAYPQLRRRLS